MAFCAICGSNHDPDYPCSAFADGMLHDAGIEKHPGMSRRAFRKLEKRADRYMLKLALIAVAILILAIAASMVVGYLFMKRHF